MLKKVSEIITWILSGALFIGAVGLLVATAPIFGAQALIVRSGSMEPAISVGDLVVVRSNPGNPQVGDVISYNPPGHDAMIITHRITDIQVRNGKTFYLTKGDANNETDHKPVPENRIIGRPVVTVPYIGKVLAFAKTKLGFFLLVIVPGLVVVLADAKAITRELWRITRGRSIPQLRRGPRLVSKPIRQYAVAAAQPAMSGPTLDDLPPPPYFQLPSIPQPRRNKHRVFVDSVVRRLAVLLAAIAITIPATQAAYTDSGVSSNNLFSAAEDFGNDGIADHVLISEIRINGPPAAADFIEFYNPTDSAVDLSGWKIRERITSGSENSIRVIPSEKSIPARGFFLWANDSISIGQDVESTQELTPNQSVALLMPDDTIVDQAAWGEPESNPQYIEGTSFPDNPGPGQSIERKALTTSTAASMGSSGSDEFKGNGSDSGDNSTDFVLRTASQPQNSTSATESP